MKRSHHRCRTLAVAGTDYDWEELYRRLDDDARSGSNDPRLLETVARLLQMLIPGVCHKFNPAQVGLRVVALAWVLSPDYFPGQPSLRELARRCGVPNSTLATLTGEISRILGWRSRAQKRAWNWRHS